MAQSQLRPPTMADVARLAGVSHQTVSRVLGDHPNVRDETRAKVLHAIEEMGYRRNSSARALVTRRTRTLGVVASDTTLYGPASTLFALEEAARAEGYLVSTVSLRKLTVEKLAEALDHLSEGGVEGVVAIAPQRSAVEALAGLRHPFPVVIVGSGPGVGIPSVNVDQHLGARLATRHLLAALPPYGLAPRRTRGLAGGRRPGRGLAYHPRSGGRGTAVDPARGLESAVGLPGGPGTGRAGWAGG